MSKIAAYDFRADRYCPDCIVNYVHMVYPIDFPLSHTLTGNESAEEILDTVAHSLNLPTEFEREVPPFNRYDETTFDTSDFPKVVFSDQLSETTRCGSCNEEL